MNWFEYIGFLATAICIAMYIPQTLSVMKHKKTGNLSKITFGVIWFGCLAWTLYAGMSPNELSKNLPGFLTNGVIAFFMLPIIWYLFADNSKQKIVFFSALIATIVIVALSAIIVFDRDLFFKNASDLTIDVLSYIFIIFAGSCTAFPFAPQMYRIVKENHVGEINILSTLLIIAANTLWVVFWLGKILDSHFGPDYISIVMSFISGTMQLPILYVYVKNRKK